MNRSLISVAVLTALTGFGLNAHAATELNSSTVLPINNSTISEYFLNGDFDRSAGKDENTNVLINNAKVDLAGFNFTLEGTAVGEALTPGGMIKNVTLENGKNVVIKQTGGDCAIGNGVSKITANNITITSDKTYAIYLEKSGDKLTLDAGNGGIANPADTDNHVITIQGAAGGSGIQIQKGATVKIVNFNKLVVGTVAGYRADGGYDHGYGIQNAGGTLNISGGEIVLNADERSALRQTLGGATKITAEKLTIDSTSIVNNNDAYKNSAVGIAEGSIDLNVKEVVIKVADKAGVDVASAINVSGTGSLNIQENETLTVDGDVIVDGKLALDTTKATVNGDIVASEDGELNLNGNLVFNGENATIGNLTGDNATFTITSADQIVELTNNTTSLTLGATGELNDALGTAAFDKIRLDGTQEGVQLYLAEGESSQSTTATLDAAGNITNVVTKNNTLMDDSLSLATGTVLSLNRIMMNDVRKRMGDLRSSEGKSGAWARYDGGRLSGNGLDNDFNTIQVGVDTVPTDNGIRFGIAANYTNGDADYTRGSADMDAYGLAAYATWMGDSGLFADVVARMATAKTDMKIDGYKTAKLDNVALSLSGEVGYRYNVTKGFFVEPQGELTYTYVDADTMKLSTGTTYEFDSVNSLIGRLGVVAGMECPNGMGNVYARVSAVHEFLGDAEVTAKSALGGNPLTQSTDGKDTWVEFGIGANINVTPSTYVWADVERTEGAALDEDWRATVGVRYAF